MMAMSGRTAPLVDGKRHPVGIVTVEDIAKWLAALVPEAILNPAAGRPAEATGGA
jgi:hypothetical protein